MEGRQEGDKEGRTTVEEEKNVGRQGQHCVL